MQKPFPITNAMREDVADKLTMQAVAQHGPRLGKALQQINAAYWEQHISKVDAELQIARKRWPGLIQVGVLAAVTTVTPKYRHEENESNRHLAYFYSRNERENAFRAKVLGSPDFSTVSEFIRKESHYSQSAHELQFRSVEGSIPRLNDMQLLDATNPLVTQALGVATEFEGVLDAGLAFRRQAMDVLMACRTSRQVEDLFPEAAKLLPQPAKNEKAMVPTELAANVRSMLSNGVPPVMA